MDARDPNNFTLTALKEALRERNLGTAGRKAELITRLMEADPSGEWMESVKERGDVVGDDNEDTGITRRERDVLEREANIAKREAALLERELQAAREEIERMRTASMTVDGNDQGPSQEGRSRQLSLNNIFNLLNDFEGSHETFNTWENQVRLLKNAYKLNDHETKVMISGKVKGKAQRWFHSNSNHLHMSIEELLSEMKRMYGRETDCVVRRKKFEERIWKRDETFADYYQEKVILANQVPITANEIVSYLIRGIPNENLRNQIKMQRFSTETELLYAMEDITLPSLFKTEVKKEERFRRDEYGKSEGPSRQQGIKQESIVPKNPPTRCYNCGETGHIATRCTKPKQEKGACYTCGNMGHQVKNCPEKDENNRKSPQQVLNVIGKGNESNEFLRKIKFEVCNENMNIVADFETQVDSASAISFIRESLIPSSVVQDIKIELEPFEGINESMLKILGMININVIMKAKEKVNVTLYVVHDKTMHAEVVLGRDLMRKLGFILVEPEGMFESDQKVREVMNIDIGNCGAEHNIINSLKINSEIPSSDKVISDVEYAINNTVNKSTGQTPSKLLFGVRQRGKVIDGIAEYIEANVNPESCDLVNSRVKASQKIIKSQEYNKKYFDKHKMQPHEYKEGDYVVMRNFDNTVGKSKKLKPYMKGPYKVAKVLRNDRYVIKSLDEHDRANRPYEGTWSAENMRPWRTDVQLSDLDDSE